MVNILKNINVDDFTVLADLKQETFNRKLIASVGLKYIIYSNSPDIIVCKTFFKHNTLYVDELTRFNNLNDKRESIKLMIKHPIELNSTKDLYEFILLYTTEYRGYNHVMNLINGVI